MQFWVYTQRIERKFLKRYLHTYPHGIIHKIQEAEATQMFMDEWIDEKGGMYI